ncbi:hypothetical protein GCM10022215_11350 [Nocardioides fonticola]|uniref:Bacterial sugar transferase domain-containing protein n=1 Tax=Nocardioides fonticola TaxID=450363 RepID=A0ABP7XF02_9ACTN
MAKPTFPLPADAPFAVRHRAVGAVFSAIGRLVALAGLLLILPLLLLIAVAIKLTSPGPVVYKQTRVGQYGRHFTIYKFRTMRIGADAELQALLAEQGMAVTGSYLKLAKDPRVTTVGGLLRKTSFDELPQLFNVLKGDMNLVGPRPQTPAEVASYTEKVWRRLLVRPGITGLWQISGRSDLAADEAHALDDEYVRNWTPMLDVAVLAKTPVAVVLQKGAY